MKKRAPIDDDAIKAECGDAVGAENCDGLPELFGDGVNNDYAAVVALANGEWIYDPRNLIRIRGDTGTREIAYGFGTRLKMSHWVSLGGELIWLDYVSELDEIAYAEAHQGLSIPHYGKHAGYYVCFFDYGDPTNPRPLYRSRSKRG